MSTYYKFLDSDWKSPFHGFIYSRPTSSGPGDWHEIEGGTLTSKNGFSGCREEDLLGWVDANLCTIEFDGELEEQESAVIGRKARLGTHLEGWNDHSARLLGADFLEHVSRFWNPTTDIGWSPADTVRTIRRFVLSLTGEDELETSCGAALETLYAVNEEDTVTRNIVRLAHIASLPNVVCPLIIYDTSAHAVGVAGDAITTTYPTVTALARGEERAWQGKRLLQYAHGKVDFKTLWKSIE
jgi:hypothetical protein